MTWYAHAEGELSIANTRASHAEGSATTTSNKAEHASGYYNVSSSASTDFGHSGNTLFSVGNGTANNARHNAFEIRQNGDIYITNKNGNDVRLQDEIGNVEINVDQVLDETTSASTNPVATQAVYNVYHEFETVVSAAINDLETKKLDENDVEQVINSVTSGSPLPVSTSAVCQYIDSHSPASSVNADWDETDETSPAFILNKPFGDECEYVVGFNGTVTLSTQAMPSGYAGAEFDAGVGGFVAGRTYRVTLDGDEFITTAVTFGGTQGTYTGLNMEAGAESPFTDTWSMYNTSTTMFTLNGGTQGQEVSIKVEELTCTTTLIDNKYINSSWEKGTGANSVKLIGNGGTASGSFSVSEGLNTIASNGAAHAEGGYTKATALYAHTEGYYTTASGQYSHVEGVYSVASGQSSHAEGWNTTAIGDTSHTEGYNTIANNIAEHASGRYNVSSSGSSTWGDSGNTLFSVGNGNGDNARHNAFEIRQNGDIYIVSGSSDIKLQDYLGGSGGPVDQTIDSGTSASTNAVATQAVYSVITSNERITAAALNDLNTNKFDTSAFTVYSGSVETTYVKKTDVDQVIDSTTSGSSDAVSTSAVYGFVTSYTPSITVDQVLDDTTSASTNPVSSKAVYDAVTDNELVWTNAYVAISGAISSHTENVDIHLTSSEKAGLTKASTITSMAGYDLSQATATAIDPLTDTLLQAIAKLEKRIYDLEHPTTNP
jgi:hypothetical protein